MSSTKIFAHYFPHLSEGQLEQLIQLGPLYREWNEKVNVISRKDMDEFYVRHVLHSLFIGHYFDLSGLRILDVGTGGGFPGVPLAIMFPTAEFLLVDSVGKKLKVADAICEALSISNVTTRHCRMEEINEPFDYITGRAVKSFDSLYSWTKHLMKGKDPLVSKGMIYLKGGEFKSDLRALPLYYKIRNLDHLAKGIEYFETKKLVHIYQAKS